MLADIFTDPIALRLAQSVVAAVLVVAMLFVVRGQRPRLEREVAVALARGIVQVTAVGLVLLVVLQGALWVGGIVLAGMVAAAAATAARRARGVAGAFRLSLIGILGGGGAFIAAMTWLGVIEPALTSLIPVGSMIIANAMNTAALALDRFRGEVQSHVGQIEAGLALGADPSQVAAPYVRSAMRAGLIPRIDNLRTLGIVWIPGLMTGMILSGSSPLDAALYQFVVLAMMLASSLGTAMLSLTLARRGAFSRAGQLLLRSAVEA